MPRYLISAIALGVSLTLSTQAADWPYWRGPARDGISQEKGWLDRFPEQGPPIAWKANVGLGYTSFVVGNGKAYTVGYAKDADTVFCFDALTGKEIWKHSYPAELGDKFFDGGTTGTPTLDGNRLYWLSRWGDFFCYDAASGKIVWQRQLAKETQAQLPDWGFTGAPTVYKNLLIVNVGDGGMAVDKATGKEVWKSGNEVSAGYTTPLPVVRKGKTEMWLGNASAYFSLEPETGKKIWNIKWLTQYGVNAADPIPYGDKVFISSGYSRGAGLYTPPPTLDAEPDEIWRNRQFRTQLNAAVLVDKHLYGTDGDTANRMVPLKCIEIETGKQRWAYNEFGSGGIVVSDGKIIGITSKGELLIAPVSPEAFTPVARAKVLNGTVWTAPVLANGLVYCRNGQGDVVAIDLRKK